MSRNISLVLPVLSLAIISLVFLRPGITGYVVVPGGMVNADVEVSTADGIVIPLDSTIQVSLGERCSSMPISSFIERSGEPFEISRGEVPVIGYIGPGYTGNYTYRMPISHFNLSLEIGPGIHRIWVRIIYNGTVISEDEEEVLV
jgi:hypothetical protein